MPIMDIDRPHHKPITNTNTTTTTTSDLFICFTSLISHSHSTSLTTSLSRRLRRNGSLTKRVQSQSPAMFQTNHHEPSSPKVTCIGQVRVKTKKQGKKIKLRACGSRRATVHGGLRPQPPPSSTVDVGGGGGGTQRWVHFPLSICETICCLFPCSKPSCFSNSNNNNDYNINNGDEVEERESGGGGTMCGGLLRWLVEVDGSGKRRDVELVVGGSDEVVIEREREVVIEREREGMVVMERECSRRRSIFDDMEFDDLFNDGINNVGCGNGGGGGGGESGRVSVCVPPKNALLLMRCRSDPKRMASLSRKLLEGQIGEYDYGGGGVVVEGKGEDCVRVCEELGVVGIEESVGLDEVVNGGGVVEVKGENCVRVCEELEESVGLDEGGEGIGEVCEGLEVCCEELERKIECVKLDEVNELEQKIECVKLDEVGELERKMEDSEVDSEELEGKIGVVEEEGDELEREMEDLVVDSEELDGKIEGGEECVKLDDDDEKIVGKVDELERKWEGLEVDCVELERNMEGEIQAEVLEVGNSEETEEQTVEVCAVKEIREESEVEQGIDVSEAKEIRDETVERQNNEVSETDEQSLQHVEESCLMEGENDAFGCSIETFIDGEKVYEEDVAVGCSVESFVAEEKMEESENEDGFAELSENQAIQMQEEQEETERDESYELFTNSSNSCSSSEVSQELDLKQKEVETESSTIEEKVIEEATAARKSSEKKNNRQMLPDCLLLMMCEPKLSMEVSKETWISSTDFIRCLPERHRNKKSNKTDCTDDQSTVSNKKTKPAAVAAQPPQLPGPRVSYPGIHPGRSSISFPTGGGPVANSIEQKLPKVKVGVGYEPLVLPRCKSAPMRSTAKFLQPELACSMWGRENGRGIEPHRPATCGVGAAGIGF